MPLTPNLTLRVIGIFARSNLSTAPRTGGSNLPNNEYTGQAPGAALRFAPKMAKLKTFVATASMAQGESASASRHFGDFEAKQKASVIVAMHAGRVLVLAHLISMT